MTTGVADEIRTEHLQNTILKRNYKLNDSSFMSAIAIQNVSLHRFSPSNSQLHANFRQSSLCSSKFHKTKYMHIIRRSTSYHMSFHADRLNRTNAFVINSLSIICVSFSLNYKVEKTFSTNNWGRKPARN